jgi:hypothetical protein
MRSQARTNARLGCCWRDDQLEYFRIKAKGFIQDTATDSHIDILPFKTTHRMILAHPYELGLLKSQSMDIGRCMDIL